MSTPTPNAGAPNGEASGAPNGGASGAPNGGAARRHTAGAFDIRNIIGMLLAVYGVILTITGLVADQALAKTGGVNANLTAGVALLVVGLVFIAWARLRPVVVDEEELARVHAEEGDPSPGH